MTATPTLTHRWTARQREVLDLLARGFTNPQIAERLGISLDGAKWHVSEVITRLGVDTREEAADYWRAENGLRRRLFRMARMAWPAAAWGRIAFAGMAVVAIGAGAVLAVLSLRGDDNPALADVTPPATAGASPSATAPASPTSDPSPTPDVIDGVTARPLALGEPVEFPPGVLLSYFVAGYATDGGSGSAHLVFRSASGQLIRTTPPAPPATLGISYSRVGNVLSPAMYAAVCTVGSCAPGVVEPSSDAANRVYRSIDGGTTWDGVGALPRDTAFFAFSGADPIYAGWPEGRDHPIQYALFPSGRALGPPTPSAIPRPLADGVLTWVDQMSGNAYSADGSKVLWTNRGASFDQLIAVAGDQTYALWSGGKGNSSDASPFKEYVGEADTNGRILSVVSRPGNVDAQPRSLIGQGLLLGNVLIDPNGQMTGGLPGTYVPALFDLNTATIHPILELSAGLAGFANGKNEHAFVSSVLLGNFAQVATGNDCLNLRESPSTTARSLVCLHDGVLLRLRDEPSQTADGVEWLSVDGPGAQHGWVSAEFVQR